MLLQNKRIILIVTALVCIFIILPLILFIVNQNSFDIYNDPLSGETVYNPKDRVSQRYNQPSNQPVVLGLSSLLKRGINVDNVEIIESYLTFYHQTKNEGKEISIDIKSITHKRVGSKSVYSFTIRPDRDSSKDSIVTVIISDDIVSSFVIKRNNTTIFVLGDSSS